MEVAASSGAGGSVGVWFDFFMELSSGDLLVACFASSPD
jgi:hypothetical protein